MIDISVILLLVLLLLIVFLIWYTDPFDESKQKTDYYDTGGFNDTGLVAQRGHSSALRQRPHHAAEGTAQLPRPNAGGSAAQRGYAGGREPMPRVARAGSGRLDLGPPPVGPPGPPPVVYFDPQPTVLDTDVLAQSSAVGSENEGGAMYRISGGDHGSHPRAAAPPPAAAPAAPEPALSNVPTLPVGGLRRSKPLVSFDNAAPWIRARTRSNSLDVDSPAEKEAAPAVPLTVPAVDPAAAMASSQLNHNMQLIDLKEIDLQNIIGGGAFGQVWKGSWHGTPVAVKTIPMLSMLQPQLDGAVRGGDTIPGHSNDAALLQAFEDEVNIFAGLRHPNICLFIGACLTMPTRAIITELVPRGSLWEALRTPGLFEKSNGSSYFWPWWVVRRVVDGTCRGLVYLHGHTPPIIHRDLKSANVLLDESFNPKICDFGLARLKDLNNVMTANVGTAQWMSPEVIKGNKYSEKADIYSLAIVAWETVTGKCPFEGMSQLEVVVAVAQNNKRPITPDYCEPAFRQLLEKCWHENPEERPSAKATLAALNSTHGPQ